jgi:nicotinamidase-related amidase
MSPEVDSSTSALLVLHYQNGLVRQDGVFAFSGTAAQVETHGCLAKTAAVVQASRAAGIPVIYVNIEFRPGFPELKKPTYPLIESIQERNAFLRGSWDAGVPEELEPGPDDIAVLADCCQGFSDELHDFAIANTLPYYATISQSEEFLAALALAAA